MIFQGHLRQMALDGKEALCRLCISCVNPMCPIRNLGVPDVIIEDETAWLTHPEYWTRIRIMGLIPQGISSCQNQVISSVSALLAFTS